MSLAGEERKRKILELLEVNGQVKAKELTKILKVSSETVRKYLDQLHHEGKLKKVYGGAIDVALREEEPPSFEREIIFADEKQRIGETAAQLVHDNDVIAIDDGSTPLQLAKSLKDKKNLTIYTNSIVTLSPLTDLYQKNQFTGRIIMLGGEVNINHQRVLGPFTLQMLNDVYIDKFFMSADGFSREAGITSYDYTKGVVTKKMIEHSRQSILLMDHSKIGKRTHYKMAEIQDIDTIVSNQTYPKDWESTLQECNIDWIVAGS